MKTPSELTREQLEDIVGQIQSILWMDVRTGVFQLDLSWDCETIEYVSGVLEDAGLKPEPVIPAAGENPDQAGQVDHADTSADAVRAALDGFIETIEATDGCHRNENGLVAPNGDPDWTDLADAYVRACAATGRTPLITPTEGEEEFAEV
jgi:hypothetical protein